MSKRDGYHRRYFEGNKNRINENRRRNYLCKKESVLGLRSLFEESAAARTKTQQQTISKNAIKNADEVSISNVEELFPEKPESEFAMVMGGTKPDQGPAEFGASPRRTTCAQDNAASNGCASDSSGDVVRKNVATNDVVRSKVVRNGEKTMHVVQSDTELALNERSSSPLPKIP